jgi:hypothetical protein
MENKCWYYKVFKIKFLSPTLSEGKGDEMGRFLSPALSKGKGDEMGKC